MQIGTGGPRGKR